MTDSESDDEPPTVVRGWPGRARCVRTARRELRRDLEGWGLGRLTDAAEVVLSELFTNALQHACPPRGHQIETRYQRADAGVRIEVRDGSTDRPVMRRDSRTAESGRGLPLVDDITEGRWGVSERGEDGKSVWALVTGGRQDEGPR